MAAPPASLGAQASMRISTGRPPRPAWTQQRQASLRDFGAAPIAAASMHGSVPAICSNVPSKQVSSSLQSKSG